MSQITNHLLEGLASGRIEHIGNDYKYHAVKKITPFKKDVVLNRLYQELEVEIAKLQSRIGDEPKSFESTADEFLQMQAEAQTYVDLESEVTNTLPIYHPGKD
jgi:flagellar biosynthesis chaperone FliJ